jgi:hypothetical protein
VSTRRVERLAEQLGVKSLSRSQVSELATHLNAQVTAFRQRPLDAGPYTFVWVDALTVKVREDGRVVNVHTLIATGVNADGHLEILGLDVASAEDGAGWLAFLRGLVARGLSGVQLVINAGVAGDEHRAGRDVRPLRTARGLVLLAAVAGERDTDLVRLGDGRLVVRWQPRVLRAHPRPVDDALHDAAGRGAHPPRPARTVAAASRASPTAHRAPTV